MLCGVWDIQITATAESFTECSQPAWKTERSGVPLSAESSHGALPGLKCTAALQGEEQLSWRARATEAVGIIAEAIGLEPFRPHVQQILASAFQVHSLLQGL